MTRLLGPLPVDIVELVAELSGVPADQIRSSSRSTTVLTARLVACWAARTATIASFPEIAAALNVTEETVRSAVKRVTGHPDLRRAAETVALEAKIRCSMPGGDKPNGPTGFGTISPVQEDAPASLVEPTGASGKGGSADG